MFVTPSGMSQFPSRLLQPLYAPFPMLVTVLGMFIFVRFVHSQNARLPMLVIPSDSSISSVSAVLMYHGVYLYKYMVVPGSASE